MHIQQIEIDNFKSFANKTVIPFEQGFTTVSGPNGSGKSNIIDSILFCLGLSSSRTMRAEKLTDLINNHSRRREASVSIMFGQSQAFDDPNDQKIVVSRRIKDNGQSGYGSTYYLNGKVTTLTEIHDALSAYNISPGAYNVLMQGDVTGIINMTATERRKIIDEIAGVAEFDRKIDQAQKELESVSGSIERFSLLLGELETRLAALSQEREQALKYQKLKDEKQQYENMLLTAKYLDLHKAFKSAEHGIVQARQQKGLSQKQVAEIDAQIAKTRDALSVVANEVKRKGEDQQIALKKQIEGLLGAISRKQDTIAFSAQKQTENIKTAERAKEEITRLEAKIEDLNTAMEAFVQLENELNTQLKKEQAQLEKRQQKLTQLSDSTGTLGQERQETRQALITAEDALSQAQRQKLDGEAQRNRLLQDQTYQQERQAQGQGRSSELTQQIQKLEAFIKDAQLEKQAFENQVHQQQLAVSKTRVDLNNATAETNRLHREFTSLDAQKRAYEDANFGRAVDTVLNAGLKGVHGTLAQLGSVDDEFSTALEIAMGARIRNIVVDNDDVAQRGIELLQERRAGRATFLPMTKMRDAGNLGYLPEDEGIIDYAINLIDFPDKYRSVFAYALGDTVIVEDMATARKYLRKYRMVTLDGSLMEKTGAMTGGSNPSQSAGKLGSNKVDQQLATLRQQMEQEDAKRDKLEKELSKAEIRLDALKSDFNQFLTRFQSSDIERASLNRELQQLMPAQASSKALAALAKEIENAEQSLAQTEQAITQAQADVARLQSKLDEIDAQLPTEQLEALKAEMGDIEFQIRSYESQIRNNQADIQSKQLEIEFQKKSIQSYLGQIEQLQQNNKTIDKEKIQLEEEILAIQTQVTALEAQTGQLDEELKRLQEERDTIQAQLIQEEQHKYKLSQELAQIEEQILAYQARKRELQPEIDAVKQELAEADIDVAEVETLELPSGDEINRNIQRLAKQMDAMGAVNMRAVQEYDEVTERHDELTEKVNTLTREREDLGIKISGYAELKLTTFMTAFDNVNHNFKEIFADLSDGEGQLILTNPTDPFSGGLTIEARPRGKKMQRMESMSGGEKSLTALAFVFSFQRYMPAPFYAFDEVDMFLDGINAEKLAHMVKKQSGNAQFIVVSLRKPMLSHSDRTVGVTQRKDGISKVTGVMLRDAS